MGIIGSGGSGKDLVSALCNEQLPQYHSLAGGFSHLVSPASTQQEHSEIWSKTCYAALRLLYMQVEDAVKYALRRLGVG